MTGLLLPQRPPSLAARRFPNAVFTTHEGATVRFYDDLIRGRMVMINFMYAQCNGICPAMTTNLQKVRRRLGVRVGRDIFLYSISLKQDPPQALWRYVEMHGIRTGWLFLTGSRKDTEALRRALGFVDPDPVLDADINQHTGLVMLGNDRIDRWTVCPSLARPEELARALLWLDPSLPRQGF